MPQTPVVDGLITSEDLQGAGRDGEPRTGDILTDAYPDWSHWYPNDERGNQGKEDGWNDPPLGDLKGGDADPIWNCNHSKEELADTTLNGSFVQKTQQLGENDFIMVYDWLCDLDDTNVSPEKTYLLEVDSPMSLAVNLKCDKECYSFLMKDGCLYDSFEGCSPGNSDSAQFSKELLPGLYLLGVEYVLELGSPPHQDHAFDIHVAMNQTAGQKNCELKSTSTDSSVESQCTKLVQTSQKSVSVISTLGWEDRDDFYLQCAHFGVAADAFGGMPDVVHAFQADFDGPTPRTVDVSLQLPEGQEGDPGEYTLAVTTSPCGAADAVVDCDWGPVFDLAISGLTVFPHETLYAVIDGIGKNAFESDATLSYKLTWTISEICE